VTVRMSNPSVTPVSPDPPAFSQPRGSTKQQSSPLFLGNSTPLIAPNAIFGNIPQKTPSSGLPPQSPILQTLQNLGQTLQSQLQEEAKRAQYQGKAKLDKCAHQMRELDMRQRAEMREHMRKRPREKELIEKQRKLKKTCLQLSEGINLLLQQFPDDEEEDPDAWSDQAIFTKFCQERDEMLSSISPVIEG